MLTSDELAAEALLRRRTEGSTAAATNTFRP